MADYPSTLVNAKFQTFFGKVRTAGVPSPADIKWLKSHGFTSSNDRRLLTILRFLDFVDDKGLPTDKWTAYRSKDGDKALGHAIIEAYKELYEYIPEAHKASRDDLLHFFRPRTTGGDITVQRQVLNFLSLTTLASFDVDQEPGPAAAFIMDATTPVSTPQNTTQQANVCQLTGSNGLTINLNVQLTLPESADARMIDQIFAAMGKHLLQHS